MKISDFISPESVKLELSATNREDALEELVSLFNLDEKNHSMLLKMLKKRERLGSTGVGKGVAIPHGRSLVITRLMIACARSSKGIEFDSIDGEPVHMIFVIVAPPQEISNLYLPVLGKIAEMLKHPENLEILQACGTIDEFLMALETMEG